MPKPRPLQNSFTTGEISPFLQRRTDFAKHAHAAEMIDNFTILPHGGLIRRSGTRYIANVQDSTENIRLIPFIVSFGLSYSLEFSGLNIRVYKDEAVVTGPIDIASPYTDTEILDLDFSQSNNVMYFTHEDHPTKKLTRTSDTVWAFSDLAFYDGPYNDILFLEVDDKRASTTLTPSALTGSINVTASASFFTAGQDEGRHIRIFHSGTPDNWGTAVIDSVTSPTIAACTVITDRDFSATTASSVWRMSTFHSGAGYPRHVTFHEERLVLGGYPGLKNKLWGSVPDDFPNFSPTEIDGSVTDANSYTYVLASGLVDTIQWMVSGLYLLVGTESGPWSVTSAESGASISPLSIDATRETSVGSSSLLPVIVDKSVLFISSTQREMFEAFYDFNTGGFITPSVSILAEHLLRNGVTTIISTIQPYRTIWGFKDDLLFSMTFLKEQKLIAFAQHHLGGVFAGGSAIIESICAIPASDLSHEQVYLVVKRVVNGNTVKFIEFIEDVFVISDSVAKEDAFFVDAGITYDSGSTTVITGLSHLEGETVSILADGAVQPDKVVSGGQITLSKAASKVHVGLPFTSKMVSLPIEQDDEGASSVSRQKRIDHIYLDLLNSLGGKYGPKNGTLSIIEYRVPSDPMDSSAPLQSGLVKVSLDMESTEEAQIEIIQDQPLPFHLRAFVAEMTIYGL